MDAVALRCPSCGAPAKAQSPHCAHCGGHLATVACPHCLQLMFQGARFCSSCGGGAVTWTSQRGKLPCPECDLTLMQGTVQSSVLNHCGRCFGIWLDTQTFAQICRESDRQSAVLGAAHVLESKGTSAEVRLRYRKCPECRQSMNRVNFARCSGVVVDVCSAHGTWFDRAELQSILRFIQQGGLEKSRRLELEYLESEQRRLERKRSEAQSVLPTMTGHYSGDPVADLVMWGIIRAAASLLEGLFDL